MSPGPTIRSDRARLVLASFLMLFIELALIRWAAAWMVYVAYFTNFVLLASFLGIGIGFIRASHDRDDFRLVPFALASTAAFVLLFQVTVSRVGSRTLVGLFGLPVLSIWIAMPILFLGVTITLATVGEGVGRLFGRFSPLDAYRLDIVGSICGIVAFSGLSFLQAKPVVWGIVIALVVVLLRDEKADRAWWLAVAGVVVIFLLGSVSPLDRWSPYYRVTAAHTSAEGSVAVKVNGLPHQSILPLTRLEQVQPFYLKPYTHIPNNPMTNVLIVGAGTGNDVTVALAHGAQHIDAVEIDPVLQSIGAARHPNHPYQDPRVTVHINDGRAFLERTDQTYDLILFALPDSLTLVSGQSSLRLESYLFTEEAMQTVRDHLNPGGAFAMYNYYRQYVFDRYANTLTQVYGHAPCFDPGESAIGARQQAVLTIGVQTTDVTCTQTWTPPPGGAPAPSTDDHPFPYVVGHTIPSFYVVSLVLILLGSVVVVRGVTGAGFGSMRPYLDLFAMGGAFLLLETKNVVQFALLFGTTWFVNSLVFAGILFSVLAAIEVTRRVRLPSATVLYGALVVALVGAWLVPPDRILSLAPVPRFLAGAGIAFAPVFLANLIFSQRFRDVGSSSAAFGANLLGAMVGGVLEYGAIVVGYRALLIFVAVLYGVAFVFSRRPATA